MRKEFTIKGCDGTLLQGIMWVPDEETKALLQITHGMTEHIGRYTLLADELNSHGIAVAGLDLRGHGRNTGDPKCASFGENGWEATLEDMHLLYTYLKENFSACPHFILGFSLGSFLVREYLNRYQDKIAGAAIIGTGSQPEVVLSAMIALVKTQIKKAGFDNTTPLVRRLSFETYNKKFAPNRTTSDWLCADEKDLDSYIADALCREDISSGLFLQLLSSMKRTGIKTAYDNWNKDIPVMLLSGKDDPVGDFGKGVERVKKAMDGAALKNVKMELFPEARHDLLHEENNGAGEKARRLLVNWILENIRF